MKTKWKYNVNGKGQAGKGREHNNCNKDINSSQASKRQNSLCPADTIRKGEGQVIRFPKIILKLATKRNKWDFLSFFFPTSCRCSCMLQMPARCHKSRETEARPEQKSPREGVDQSGQRHSKADNSLVPVIRHDIVWGIQTDRGTDNSWSFPQCERVINKKGRERERSQGELVKNRSKIKYIMPWIRWRKQLGNEIRERVIAQLA